MRPMRHKKKTTPAARLDDLEQALRPDDTKITVHIVTTDAQGREVDYFTGEPILHAPGDRVIEVKPPDWPE